MAIYGELETHALTDVLRVLRNRVRTLFLHMAYRGKTLELSLSGGHLWGLYVDGFPVQGPDQLQEIVHYLIHQGRGKFEFQALPDGELPAQMFDVPLEPLLRKVMTDDFVPQSQLPHLETRFALRTDSEVPAEVPAALQDTWIRVWPLLVQGADARLLMQVLGMPELEARGLLYRLRALELVTPVRAGAPGRGRHEPARTSVAPQPQAAQLVPAEPAVVFAPVAAASRATPPARPVGLAHLGLDDLVPAAPGWSTPEPVPSAPGSSGTVERPVLQKLLGALRRFAGGAR